jgi:glyceraldehyde 3-phosphate dehydrogenase
MTVKIGINGFGRMGRLGLRAGWGREDIAVTQVNEIATDATASAHLLKFDSVHGTWDEECSADGDAMIIGGKPIAYSRNATIDETDWSGCDIVIEATGKHHKKPETLQTYFDKGVKKVVVAAPTEGELKGILGYEERPLVSVDYLNDPRSSIVDALSTMVIDDTQVKVYAWYDNEWGYVNRMM